MKNILGAFPLLCCFLMMSCEKEVITETITVTDTLTITRTVNLDSGLIAYYPFNGNANDESGNNKNGVLVNGTAFSTDAKNNANKAANLDGVDDFIRVTDQTNYFSRNKMTIVFQFNLRDVSARSTFINKSNYTPASGVSWGSGIQQNGGQSFVEFLINDNPTTDCQVLWYFTPAYYLKSTVPLQSNKWYHVSLVYNQGVELIYINGLLSGAKVNSNSYLKQCTSADLRIGGWWQNDIISTNGKIDEVRFYDRILGENEISKLATEIN